MVGLAQGLVRDQIARLPSGGMTAAGKITLVMSSTSLSAGLIVSGLVLDAIKALGDMPEGRISLADPDARARASRPLRSGHADDIVQSTVDAATHLIAAPKGRDRDLLARMGQQARPAPGRGVLHILAAKGDVSGQKIPARHHGGITATGPRPDSYCSRARGRVVKADVACEPGAGVDRCPAMDRTSTGQQGLRMRRSWTNGCQGCALSRSVASRDMSVGSHGGNTSILSRRRRPTGAARLHRWGSAVRPPNTPSVSSGNGWGHSHSLPGTGLAWARKWR